MIYRILIKAGLLSFLPSLILTTALTAQTDLGTNYINAWKKFYPSKALNQGMHTAIFDYEDYSPKNIAQWVQFNQTTLNKLVDNHNPYVKKNRIDARLLKVQVQAEINKWDVKKTHQYDLSLYTSLITKATNKILDANYLITSEKVKLVCQRLEAVQNLSTVAQESLINDNKVAIEKGIKTLERAVIFYKTELPNLTTKWKKTTACNDFIATCQTTAWCQ